MLRLLLQQKNISLYRLEKETELAHSTLLDIYHERVNIEKCSAFILNKIAKALNMSMDDLYNVLTYRDLSLVTCDLQFDLFKSNVCHNLKRLTIDKFIEMYSDNEEIIRLYNESKMYESTYLLSLLDNLCNETNKPLVDKYNQIRQSKFDKLIVPESIYYLLMNKQTTIEEIYKESLPEFLKHNIAESELDLVPFRYFRNNTLHELKRLGPINFIHRLLEEKTIDFYWKRNDKEKALYLLALLDYLFRINNLSSDTRKYEYLRNIKMPTPLFVGGDSISFNSIEEAEHQMRITVIPEFKKFNIIEEDIFNVA
ncbi:MAG: helix-turn-helix transcriptional regulator [Bacilli bacterium]|nr:helix-turn-helix transcriptional regulator [Bacilli bacterium]